MTIETTTPKLVARRLLSIGATASVVTIGMFALATPAYAADANSQVWVCKYVQTPGGDEVLKDGKNPIEVNGHSVDKDKDGQIFVGDQFADAQERSVVVQIGGDDPGADICSPTPPPDVTPTNPPNGGGTPGTTAPHTGGEGTDDPIGLAAGGLLLVGAGALVAEAERRRRAARRR
jgi:hypothetical protein